MFFPIIYLVIIMDYNKLKMTKDEYLKYAEGKVTPSNIYLNCLFAFIFGGIICSIGQIFVNISMYLGVPKVEAYIISTIILIFTGALLTALRLYCKIGKIAGAGSIIPITGFSNSIVSPAIEYKTEGIVLGIGANMFKIAGPVLVYGIVSSFVVGFIYWLYLILF